MKTIQYVVTSYKPASDTPPLDATRMFMTFDEAMEHAWEQADRGLRVNAKKRVVEFSDWEVLPIGE
jgi:hypothetical protein